MEKNKDLSTYFNLMLSAGSVAIYNFVQDYKLLDCYELDHQFTATEFAKKHQFVLAPTEVLLRSLEVIGLVTRMSDSYKITLATVLLRGNYKKLSAEYWEHLPILLKSGSPFKKMDDVGDSEMEYQQQVKSLEWMMGPSADLMAEKILKCYPKITNNNELKVMDIGAGSGIWSYQFLYKLTSAQATLVDWPAVLKIAKATAKDKGIEKRVNTIEGNFLETSWPLNQFHIATLGNVTHILPADANKILFKKIYNSLEKGGILIILDAYGKAPEGELARSLYQMGLTIRTIQGKVFSPEEMRPWLENAGFEKFDFHSLEVIPYSMGMFIAQK